MSEAVKRIGATTDILGEGPIWCEQDETLYWVDIRGRAVRRHRPHTGETTSWAMPDMPGSLALCEQGRLMVALRTGLHRFNLGTGALEMQAPTPERNPDLRFNDGKVDPQGRFWVGTLNHTARLPQGSLYRYEPEQGFQRVLDGITIPNSLCWSPDGRTMYFSDSWIHTLWAFPFDPDTGALGERRVLTRTKAPAVPDGAAIDAEGCLWFAAHDGWRVVRCAADGTILREIELPVQLPTAVAFGGSGLRTLFVTTKTYSLEPDALARQPLSGALLALDPGVAGRPEPRFRY